MRVALALNARTRGQVQTIVGRLQGVAAEFFWIPTTVDDGGDRLVLEYALEQQPSQSFTSAQTYWRSSLATHLPELVGLAIYLESCVRVLDQIDVPALIAPACLRYTPDSGARSFGAWRLMVVPLVDVALADWARAAPDAWAWTSSKTLLGKPGNSAFSIGAALHQAIIDERHTLPASERFRRLVRGHVGGELAGRIAAALPSSFAGEGAFLAEVIRALLDGEAPGERLQELGEALSAHRTAVRWEYEGRIDTARAILERHAATSPAEAVPWDVLARLRSRDRDAAGALDAVIDSLAAGDRDAVRELAAAARRIAHSEEHGRRQLIERAVAAADRHPALLGDAGRLLFADIEARHLDKLDAARARLAEPPADAWDNVVRELVLARIAAARTEWALAAKLCKSARLATQRMPFAGGELGKYVVAYLDYLDGVAHFGAIAVYNDPLYLADAFTRFVASIDAARTILPPDDPLVEGTVHWLAWIGGMAVQMQVPDATAIRTGVEAYISAQGFADRISEKQRREVPPLVWYDASRVLALSGAP